ncbi:MAG: glycosyltransferase family 4 protein [Candidatus Omnitrophica bacterium]|nr:glycosyltransferase family 4 protein [Candidatus Omnitrophota bacterium]
MKALLLCASIFRLGGIDEFNQNLFKALELEFKDSEFTVISLLDNKEEAFSLWVNLKLLFCSESSSLFLKKIVFSIKSLKIILSKKPAYVICTHLGVSQIAYYLSKVCKFKYAVITHGKEVWDLKRGNKYRILESADLILTVSNYTRTKLINNHINPAKVVILKNMVDTGRFYPEVKNRQLLKSLSIENKKILLTVGRIVRGRHKGYYEMLEVVTKLSEDYVWLVVGSGNDLSRLISKAQENKIMHKIRFCENVRRKMLVDYYNLCDVFVMPSKEEGFGIVFLEALACGKPVITGNKDGSREALLDGRLGTLINPDNIEEIISAVQSICLRGDGRPSEFLRKEVEDNFGIKVFNERVRLIFSEFLK